MTPTPLSKQFNNLRTEIEAMCARGLTAPRIAQQLNCDLRYVYQVSQFVSHAARRDETMPYADDDERHYEAVLAEGGYPTAYHLDGKTYLINVWGRPWAHNSQAGRQGRAA